MRPIDSVTMKEWSGENSHVVQDKIKAEVLEELRARDAANGIPQTQDLYDDNGVKTGVGPSYQVYRDDGEGHYVVDQHLASLKHTGREYRLMVTRRWIQFCAEPRNEVELSAAAGLTARQKELARTLERTSEVEATDGPIAPEKSTPPETVTMGEPDPLPNFVVEPPKPFVCDDCGRDFRHKGHLTNHRKRCKEAVVVGV